MVERIVSRSCGMMASIAMCSSMEWQGESRLMSACTCSMAEGLTCSASMPSVFQQCTCQSALYMHGTELRAALSHPTPMPHAVQSSMGWFDVTSHITGADRKSNASRMVVMHHDDIFDVGCVVPCCDSLFSTNVWITAMYWATNNLAS